MSQARSKVSVLGAGRVGSAVANALVLLRVCDLVVLYDRDLARAEGQAWDIGDAVPLLSEMVVVPTAEYSDLDGSDVVVVTVGPTLAVGQTRLDLARVNAGIIAGVVRQLDRVCPVAVVILVSNPVDVLTRIAIEASTRPPHLIFGCGTVLEGRVCGISSASFSTWTKTPCTPTSSASTGTARFRSGRARPWERSGSSNTAFPTAPRCHRSSTIWRRRSAAGG
jgi:lactate/malate dehydrogenase, NAD binding domain